MYHGFDLEHKRLITPPTLVHRQHGAYNRWFLEKDHWELITSLPDKVSTASYILAIRHYWDGERWDHYEFVAYDASYGEPVRLVSEQDLKDRVEAIAQHEGDDAAEEWVRTQDETRIITKWEESIRDALIRRWEAISELVGVSVTL